MVRLVAPMILSVNMWHNEQMSSSSTIPLSLVGVVLLGTGRTKLGLVLLAYVLFGLLLKRLNKTTTDVLKGINLQGRVAIVTGIHIISSPSF
jgi:uncharacterized membrane protein